MNILGLNAYHGDASACLFINGKLVAAAEEERFRRVKHWAGFPARAIRYCLEEAGIGIGDIEHVAVNSDPKAHLLAKTNYVLKPRPELRFVLDQIRNLTEHQSLEAEFARSFPDASFSGIVHRVEHQVAHLASCFLLSPFEEAVTVSVDGFGDLSSTAWGVGKGTRIAVDGHVYFPHSLGIFYEALTQYLGFPYYGDEHTVMGLASYGQPRHVDAMRRIVRLNNDGSFSLNTKYFRHDKQRIDFEWPDGPPVVGTLYSDALIDLLGPARRKDEPLEQKHRDIACSVQAIYEETFFRLLDTLHARYRLDNLTLAGRCAMNSVANGKVRRQTKFKQLYVPPAAGDAGGAIGAAIAIRSGLKAKFKQYYVPSAAGDAGGAIGLAIAIRSELKERRSDDAQANRYVLQGDTKINRMVMDHAFWGSHFDNTVIANVLETNAEVLRRNGCLVEKVSHETELCRRTAEAIAEGMVVGWFQGRMEWGPRALGNRSIVCDPRRAAMKKIINIKIKRRESFRPFALSILREFVGEWFEEEKDVPFMMQVNQIKPSKCAHIPAVTHVDGSGRLQTVSRVTNPRYWQLIEAFRRLTDVPILLNTSLNENEPIVCQPSQALSCFLRTKMDVLVLGDWKVSRVE